MTCNHTKQIRRWVGNDYWNENGGSCHTGDWEFDSVSTIVDIDLHRYKCTQCGKVMYYSGAAREYYETGVDRKGLFK